MRVSTVWTGPTVVGVLVALFVAFVVVAQG
jgi:hypothetical protein